ncbi:MAG: hypothetical protein Q8J78_09860 [Moraxellaceae bacterium]|nr:hypothetical protein [Moraxellaceae bacterium]
MDHSCLSRLAAMLLLLPTASIAQQQAAPTEHRLSWAATLPAGSPAKSGSLELLPSDRPITIVHRHSVRMDHLVITVGRLTGRSPSDVGVVLAGFDCSRRTMAIHPVSSNGPNMGLYLYRHWGVAFSGDVGMQLLTASLRERFVSGLTPRDAFALLYSPGTDDLKEKFLSGNTVYLHQNDAAYPAWVKACAQTLDISETGYARSKKLMHNITHSLDDKSPAVLTQIHGEALIQKSANGRTRFSLPADFKESVIEFEIEELVNVAGDGYKRGELIRHERRSQYDCNSGKSREARTDQPEDDEYYEELSPGVLAESLAKNLAAAPWQATPEDDKDYRNALATLCAKLSRPASSNLGWKTRFVDNTTYLMPREPQKWTADDIARRYYERPTPLSYQCSPADSYNGINDELYRKFLAELRQFEVCTQRFRAEFEALRQKGSETLLPAAEREAFSPEQRQFALSVLNARVQTELEKLQTAESAQAETARAYNARYEQWRGR